MTDPLSPSLSPGAFLVLGGTGKTGRRVAARLRVAGHTVRAASRSGAVRFDWTERATWERAVEGAAAVYLVAPDDPAPTDDFVKAAVAAGTRRIVLLSGRGSDLFGEVSFGSGVTEAERAVRASGVEWSVIRPNNFDQNFDEDLWHRPLVEGRLALPTGGVPEPFVDLDDVADVAVALLTDEGHHGRTYELSGPRALTFAEAVDIVARAAGRPIASVELTPDEYRAELLAEGWPPEAVDGLDAMFGLMRTGAVAEPVDGVRRVLGREATPFETYAVRAAAAGAWAGATP
ncbi:NAD(P)H-binding protein [Streptomyces radicis]|uniref:SDR family NAD(P)-dependent oxidoreductase n=1 Tax=Streptomyces radicis TaxID=1750517 RepID=A0A3A9WQJ2_9ACTN|nr:NAD(P)H-binding protein [Streptomyces radicis]RKN10036.1 SDR family NAD(P)-dependent oxidoreductase [Streptomyces radicis]RKN24377.1 SDR family NAD(P)-dependent oxidoreductase [Streptomyces radicis]